MRENAVFCRGLGLAVAALLCALGSHAQTVAQYTAGENNLSYLVIEAETGFVLAEHNADEVRPPASMLKMMMMLLVAEGIEDGSWSLNDEIVTSRKAAEMWGSQVYLREGEVWTLGDLMVAVSVRSANDGAMAVAEGLWGSEEAYLERMNERALELGMVDTKFHSVNGLPPSDNNTPFDQTTARDMAILAQWCVTHPQIMEWVGMRQMNVAPRSQDRRNNTNRLLTQMPDADGLKTGYIRAAGYCVTATAERNGVRLIAVVMGFQNSNNRFHLAEHLLTEGFDSMRRVLLFAQGEPMEDSIEVRNSEAQRVHLQPLDDVWVSVHVDSVYDLEVITTTPAHLRAPLGAGAEVGRVRVQMNGSVLAETPLIVAEAVEEAGWRWKLKHSLLRNLQTQPATTTAQR